MSFFALGVAGAAEGARELEREPVGVVVDLGLVVVVVVDLAARALGLGAAVGRLDLGGIVILL